MTSNYEDDISTKDSLLSPFFILKKGDTSTFGPRVKAMLEDQHNEDVNENYISGSILYLKSLADEIGLYEEDIVRIVGGRGNLPSSLSVEDLLRSSRDSRFRLSVVLSIFTLLGEAYDSDLPKITKIEETFHEPLQKILLEGDLVSLLKLQSRLENRAGGRNG